jgi:TolA-binding protein
MVRYALPIWIGWLVVCGHAVAADLEFAHGLYRQKRYEIAAEEYQRYLNSAPSGPLADEARFYLAECRVQLGRPDQALVEYDKLIADRNPRRAQYRLALFRAGELRMLADRFADAAPLLQRFVDAFPNDELSARAWLYLAEAQLHDGRLEQARASLTQAQRFGPKNELADRLVFVRARLAMRERRLDEADRLLRGLAERTQSDFTADARLALAVLDYEKGRFLAALEALNRFVATNAKSRLVPTALFYIGRAALEAKQPQEVRRAYDLLVRDFPESPWRDRLALTLAEAMLLPVGDDPAGTRRIQTFQRLRSELSSVAARQRVDYLEALFQFDQQAYARCVEILESLLRTSAEGQPGSDARYLLGAAQARLGRWAAAAENCEKYLSGATDPALVPAAVRTWAETLARLDDSPAVRQSLERLTQCTQKHPDRVELLLTAADLQYAQKRYSRARLVYERARQAAADNPQQARARLGVGWCLFETRDFAQARQSFALAAQSPKLEPKLLAEARYMAGVCAQETNNPDDAIAFLRRVVAEHPQSEFFIDAGQRAARLLASRKQPVQADEIYRRLVEGAQNSPLRPKLVYDRAALALEHGQTDLAVQGFTELVDRHSTSELAADALAKLGDLLMDQGRTEEARVRFEQLLNRSDGQKFEMLARLRIAQADLLAKRWQQAHDEAAKLLERAKDPSIRDEALFVLGRARQQQARFDEARQYYARAIGDKKTELAAKAQFMTGETYFHEHRFDDAIKAFLKVDVLYSYPSWQAAALFEIGKCYERKNDPVRARSEYRRLLDRFPDSQLAQQAWERLSQLGDRDATGGVASPGDRSRTRN